MRRKELQRDREPNRSTDIDDHSRRRYLKGAAVSSAGVLSGLTGFVDSGRADPNVINEHKFIDSSGVYELGSDIEAEGHDSCITINARGVTLNGNGHTIAGNNNGAEILVYAAQPLKLRGFTVKNFQKECVLNTAVVLQ